MSMNNLENGKVLMETERLVIREMVLSDHEALCKIMCDEDTMYTAYGRAFSVEEVQNWLNKSMEKYKIYGFGLWVVVLKETHEVIGQCGLMPQKWKEQEILEIGYLFRKAFWHKGYATEAAMACKEYAFSVLGADSIYAAIRDTNTASQYVAKRIGMNIVDQDVKDFRNVEMNFFLYCAERANEQK